MHALRETRCEKRGVLVEIDAVDVGMRRKAGPLDDLDLEPLPEPALPAPRRPTAHHAPVDEDDPWSLREHVTNARIFG